MPKYLKDTKIEYWKIGPSYKNDEGVTVPGKPYKVADLWANFKGKSFEAYYAARGTWAEPIFEATFTRPGFAVELTDYVYLNGKYYSVKEINDLTGHPHSDMKITVQYDAKKQSLFKDARG